MLLPLTRTDRPGPRTRWTRHVQTRTPPDSPVTVDELWSWLEMPGDAPGEGEGREPLLSALLATATERVWSYTDREMDKREIVTLFDFRALEGHTSHDLLTFPLHDEWLTLPRVPVASIDSVEQADGDGGYTALTDYVVDTVSEPARIQINASLTFPGTVSTTAEAWFGALRVTYQAGYDTVPQGLKHGILALAAYLYDHRGCDLSDAFSKSGAKSIVSRYRVYTGL